MTTNDIARRRKKFEWDGAPKGICTICSQFYEENVEHAGKDYPAMLGEKPAEHRFTTTDTDAEKLPEAVVAWAKTKWTRGHSHPEVLKLLERHWNNAISDLKEQLAEAEESARFHESEMRRQVRIWESALSVQEQQTIKAEANATKLRKALEGTHELICPVVPHAFSGAKFEHCANHKQITAALSTSATEDAKEGGE